MSAARLRGPVAPAPACILACLALVSCGGGSKATEPVLDPASIIPADAPLYFDATVRPQGDARDAVDGVLAKLLGTQDAGASLIKTFDDAVKKDGVSYENDVAPWLGEHAAIFASGLERSSPDAAAVLADTDPEAAKAALDRAAAGGHSPSPVRDGSYEGVSYRVQDGAAFGLVGDFVVLGTESGFKATVDASKGDSLADSGDFTSALGEAPEDRIATAYADPAAILDAIVKAGQIKGFDSASFGKQLAKAAREPVVGWVDATPDSLGISLSAGGAPKLTNGESLIAGFPADAWLAFGGHSFGQGITQGLQDLQSIPGGSFGEVSPEQAFRAQTGLDLGTISRWLDDVSGYISGSGLFSLGGAVVLSSRDDSAQAQTLAQIHSVVTHDIDLTVQPLRGEKDGFSVSPQGVPIEIDVARRDGNLIAGLGSGSIDNALSPSSSLSDSAGFKDAAAALGSNVLPSFYLDFQPIEGFLSLPGVPDSPQIQQIKPFLDRLDYLAAGAGNEGGRVLARLVLGVREGAGPGDVTASRMLPFAAAP